MRISIFLPERSEGRILHTYQLKSWPCILVSSLLVFQLSNFKVHAYTLLSLSTYQIINAGKRSYFMKTCLQCIILIFLIGSEICLLDEWCIFNWLCFNGVCEKLLCLFPDWIINAFMTIKRISLTLDNPTTVTDDGTCEVYATAISKQFPTSGNSCHSPNALKTLSWVYRPNETFIFRLTNFWTILNKVLLTYLQTMKYLVGVPHIKIFFSDLDG